ncbi:MAG: hypothetical protein PVH89_00390 [Gammaproteobacteria bacterium]|jgi:hypothetical protein
MALSTTAIAGTAHAQTGTSALSGRATLGVRSVDVDGSLDKYREDINLDDGVRLFDFSFSYAPEDDGTVDRVDVDVSNLGSDPFETIRLSARKFGSYEVTLNRRRSEYYYRDIILPAALASIDGSTGGDFHSFDFARQHDSADASFYVSPATKLLVGLDRYTRTGDSSTTLDIERDEFDLERPIDESMDTLRLGVEHSWDKLTLVVEQQMSDFENVTHLSLPGASTGSNTGDPAELAFFRFDEAADYDSLAHVFRVVARPNDRLNLSSTLRFESLDLDLDAAEESAGVDFTGQPFTTDVSGTAGADRDLALGDIDLSYRLSDRLQFVGGVRRQELEQNGVLAYGDEPGLGSWDITTTGTEAGIEVAASDRIIVSAGISGESRDVSNRGALGDNGFGGDVDTDRDGFFARIRFRSVVGFELTASIEDNNIDDAFALSSPTDSRRYRLRGRYRWDNGLAVSASWRLDEHENRISAWAGDTEQTSVRVAYDRSNVNLSFGLGTIDISRDIEQLVTGGFRQDLFSIAYRADSDLLDATARWRLNQRFTLGFGYYGYENGGSYALDRDDLRAYVEIDLQDNYFLQLRVRSVEYDEDAFDRYEADSLEAAFGLEW